MADTSTDAGFTQTRWSLVLQAGNKDPGEAKAALGELFERYRSPMSRYLRGKRRSHEAAEDLLQEFFQKIIEKRWLAEAQPNRGRFRSFLLASLKHFDANDWRRNKAERRGGGKEIVSLDDPEAAQGCEHSVGNAPGPDALFDQRWAFAVLEHAQAKLRLEYERDGEIERFVALEPRLPVGRAEDDYATLATGLGLTVNGVKANVSRMRLRLGKLMREEVADTVASRGNVESEMRHLLAILLNPQ